MSTARPNKVFFIHKEFNFIQSEFTLDSYKETFLKAMVSGFGPYPVISVKVVDKVATVDIGQKARLYGGVKINIDGTGVAVLDTWHEIDKVDGNTFTFNVDAPNGNYTAGITMGYPSLGWSLADRDGNNYLFKSGVSGTSTHYVRISFNKDRPANWPDANKWRNTLTMEKVECDGTLNSIRMVIPKDYSLGIYLAIEINAPANYDHHWYFYGDDAFVVLGHKGYWYGGTLYIKRTNMWQCMFGETSRTAYKNGVFFMNGLVNPNQFWSIQYSPESGVDAAYSGFGGMLAGTNWSFISSLVASTVVNERNNYMDQVAVSSTIPLFGDGTRCGFNFDRFVTKYINNNLYGEATLWNRNWEHIGSLPGIVYTVHMPNMTPAFTYIAPHNGVDVLESFLKPIFPMGRLKDRKCYAFFSGGYNQTQAGGNNPNNINWPWQSSCVFDLTGPIR